MKVIFEIDQPTVQKVVMSQLETGIINAKTADAITKRLERTETIELDLETLDDIFASQGRYPSTVLADYVMIQIIAEFAGR